MSEFTTPGVRHCAGVAAAVMLLAGCGESAANHPKSISKEKRTVTYADGMRIESSPSTIIIDLCRGNILTHEVIKAYLQEKVAKNRIKIDSHGPDAKCADDGVITAEDFQEHIPAVTTNSGANA